MTKQEDSLLSKSKREIEKRMTILLEQAHNYIELELLLDYGLSEKETEEYHDLEDQLDKLQGE